MVICFYYFSVELYQNKFNRMNNRSPVSGIMTKEVIVANLDNTFSQVMEFFNTWQINHLPVTFNEQLIGILSINDVLSFIYHRLMEGIPYDFAEFDKHFVMKNVMTHDPITLHPDAPIERAFEILSEGKFQALPITKEHILVGILTNKDLVKHYRIMF